jgi:hypothetical protein
MMFHVRWTRRDSGASDEADRQLLAILEKFTPPEGVTIHSWLERIDGTGGFAVLEATDPTALAAGFPIFNPYVAFEVTPVIQHDEGVAALTAAVAFRADIS